MTRAIDTQHPTTDAERLARVAGLAHSMERIQHAIRNTATPAFQVLERAGYRPAVGYTIHEELARWLESLNEEETP